MTPKQKLCKRKSCVCGYIRHFQGRIRENEAAGALIQIQVITEQIITGKKPHRRK